MKGETMETGPTGIRYDHHTAGMLAIVGADLFGEHFNAARALVPQVAEATSDFVATDDDMYALSLDGRSGFCVRADNELVYVFSTVRGRGDDLVAKAISWGATRLDCFEGYLVDFYVRNGFRVTDVEENWTAGGPRVVFMRARSDA